MWPPTTVPPPSSGATEEEGGALSSTNEAELWLSRLELSRASGGKAVAEAAKSGSLRATNGGNSSSTSNVNRRMSSMTEQGTPKLSKALSLENALEKVSVGS